MPRVRLSRSCTKLEGPVHNETLGQAVFFVSIISYSCQLHVMAVRFLFFVQRFLFNTLSLLLVGFHLHSLTLLDV